MKRKNKTIFVAIFCLCILFLCACAKEQREADDKARVGVTYYNKSDTFLNQLIDCLKNSLINFLQKTLKSQ